MSQSTQVAVIILNNSIVLHFDGRTVNVAKGDGLYQQIVNAYREKRLSDIPAIVDPSAYFKKYGAEFDEETMSITIKGEKMPKELVIDIGEPDTGQTFSTRAVPHNTIRKLTAARMTDAKRKIPHFYLGIECDVARATSFLKRLSSNEPETADVDNPNHQDGWSRFAACAVAQRRVYADPHGDAGRKYRRRCGNTRRSGCPGNQKRQREDATKECAELED